MPRPQPRPALAKAPVRDHPVAPTREPESTTSELPATAETDPMVRMSTRLHRSTQRRLKIYAATTDQPIQVIVEALITDMLDRRHVSWQACQLVRKLHRWRLCRGVCANCGFGRARGWQSEHC